MPGSIRLRITWECQNTQNPDTGFEIDVCPQPDETILYDTQDILDMFDNGQPQCPECDETLTSAKAEWAVI